MGRSTSALVLQSNGALGTFMITAPCVHAGLNGVVNFRACLAKHFDDSYPSATHGWLFILDPCTAAGTNRGAAAGAGADSGAVRGRGDWDAAAASGASGSVFPKNRERCASGGGNPWR